MYDKKFWDEVYKKGFKPWSDKNKDTFFAQKIIQDAELTQSAKVLDYGCGEGILGKYFLAHGLNVDFAEISGVQVEALRKALGDKSTVYQVNEPQDIEQKYDMIICSGVMHHIEPQKWESFLRQFQGLLKKGGALWIAGFDADDKIVEQYHGNAPATGHKCWTVNELGELAEKIGFEVSANYAKDIKLDSFETPRRFHIFCLKPKKEQSKTKDKAPNLAFNQAKDRVEYANQKLQTLRDDRHDKDEKNVDELSSKQKKMQKELKDKGLSVEDMGKTGEKNGEISDKNRKVAAIQKAVYQKILDKKGKKR